MGKIDLLKMNKNKNKKRQQYDPATQTLEERLTNLKFSKIFKWEHFLHKLFFIAYAMHTFGSDFQMQKAHIRYRRVLLEGIDLVKAVNDFLSQDRFEIFQVNITISQAIEAAFLRLFSS